MGSITLKIAFMAFLTLLLWIILAGLIQSAGGFTWKEFIKREMSDDDVPYHYYSTPDGDESLLRERPIEDGDIVADTSE